MDLIGSLPEEVLGHILSFLTTKEAALTATLSKKWRNLWELVPILDIDDSVFLNPEEGKREREGMLQSFMVFVDRVLALQGDSPINKFSLKCKTGIDTERVNLWICNVLKRGVKSLELVLDFPRSDDDSLDSDYMYFLPGEMFLNSKLVELRLKSEFGIDWWYGETSLPMLKTLSFESEWILLGDDLEVFLSAFPVLEEFYMTGIEWPDSNESASSASLRKLTIYAGGFQDFQNPKSISFDTPNLVYLDYSDFVAADYPKVNLPNLAEAVLDLKVTEHQVDLIREPDEEDGAFLRLKNVWKLISGVRNVQSLFLSPNTLEVLSMCCESMPVFNNLKVLRIISDTELGWQAMPVLLRNCPRLETLVLGGLLHHVTDKCGDVCDCLPREDKGRSLLSCPVKKLQIKLFQGTVREKEMIRHFLESFPCLDEMEVFAAKNDNDATNLEAHRIYKIIATKVDKEEVNIETVLQSSLYANGRLVKSDSIPQTEMEEISSLFTPRNNEHLYDMVFICHGKPPPPPEMSNDYLQEKIVKLNEDLKERQLMITEKKRELEALFHIIADLSPPLASALRDLAEAKASNNQEITEKKREVEALLDSIADQNPQLIAELKARLAPNLERAETSRDNEMTELD